MKTDAKDSAMEEAQRLKPDDKQPDLEKGEAAEEEPPKPPVSAAMTMKSLLTILPLALLGIGALFVLVPMIPTLGGLGYAGGGVALVGSIFACILISMYGGMKYQLDRFKKENDRLSRTNTRLEEDVTGLEETNVQLGAQVDKLSGTVDELQVVSDDLQQNVGQFADVRKNLEDFAAKTGKDISQVIGDVNGVYDKIFDLTVKNEKALLQRIAADIEFMDRDEAMSKQEFERFIMRIPKHLKERFASMGTSFEEIAGEDMVIDHHEMAALIDKLIEENAGKTAGAS